MGNENEKADCLFFLCISVVVLVVGIVMFVIGMVDRVVSPGKSFNARIFGIWILDLGGFDEIAVTTSS